MIKDEQLGILVAQDGTALPSGYIVAPKPVDDPKKPHKFFQDGQAFIESQGYRGPQLDTLQPGEYYINPNLFAVKRVAVTEVLPGYVGVLRSNIGLDLVKDDTTPKPISKKPDFEQPIHDMDEVVLTTDKNQRGIWHEPVAPGKYNLNTLAFSAYLVPTSAVTIDWASGTDIRAEHIVGGQIDEVADDEKAKEFFKFGQLRVTSKDGFQLEVDVRLIIRVRPEHASFVIARFGSVANLIEQIVHPLIDSSFRNKAGDKKAVEFFADRTTLQNNALERAVEEFKKYHVEAQNLLIAYIKIPQELLETQTFKEIAMQQQSQYEQQALANEKFITVKEKEARALKQKDVIDAKLSIEIYKDKADAMRQEADGIRDKTMSIARGDAFQNREVGKGIADAYNAQAQVIGPEILGLLKALQQIADGGVKVTPDVLVTGGADGSSGSLVNTLLAMLIKDGALKMIPVASQQPGVVRNQTMLPSLPVEKAEAPQSAMKPIVIENPVINTQPDSSESFKYLADDAEPDTASKSSPGHVSPARVKPLRTKRGSQ
jgi:hypothetical protein